LRTNLNRPAMILAAVAALLLSLSATVSAAEVARIPWFSKGAIVQGPGIGEVRWVFPKVAENRRLDVQFVSCGIREPSPSIAPYHAFVGVNNALSNLTRRILLPWIRFTYPGGSVNAVSYDISQPIVMSFNEGERPQVAYVYFGTGSLTFIPCTLSGELVFLQ
jgi:hypothetical protein